MAATRGFYTAIIALLDAGADPLIKDKAGRRALDLLLGDYVGKCRSPP